MNLHLGQGWNLTITIPDPKAASPACRSHTNSTPSPSLPSVKFQIFEAKEVRGQPPDLDGRG
jgi:hypothetical protein